MMNFLEKATKSNRLLISALLVLLTAVFLISMGLAYGNYEKEVKLDVPFTVSIPDKSTAAAVTEEFSAYSESEVVNDTFYEPYNSIGEDYIDAGNEAFNYDEPSYEEEISDDNNNIDNDTDKEKTQNTEITDNEETEDNILETDAVDDFAADEKIDETKCLY